MAGRILIVCLDGCGPDYLAATEMPNLDRLAEAGFLTVGRSVIPSVTNVNNASLITGTPPLDHGITANYRLDPRTGREYYLESAHSLRRPTILEKARRQGQRTALLTAKSKLLDLLGAGADYLLSAEIPDREMVDRLGPPPDIYSSQVNRWLLKAYGRVLEDQKPDLTYLSTTDGIFHRYGPEKEEAAAHLAGLDEELGRIMNLDPDLRVFLTADHGMSAKSRGLDLERALRAKNLSARAIPIIKDRYRVHHRNLGGAAYIHLREPASALEAADILLDLAGVEEVWFREEAAGEFELDPEGIGDLLVLGDQMTVFGTFDRLETPLTGLRSHGSRYESLVPILSNSPNIGINYQKNYHVTARSGLSF